jgi:hypothetical protein
MHFNSVFFVDKNLFQLAEFSIILTTLVTS